MLKGIRVQIVSVTAIPFIGKGVWTIKGLDEKNVPDYGYAIYRINDTSAFEFEEHCPISAERFLLFLVFDRTDREYKMLAISMSESPEFFSIIQSCDIFETEFYLKKNYPDDSVRYYSTPIHRYEYDIDLGDNEQAWVERHFKRKSLKQIRMLERASNCELQQQHTRQLLS